MALGFDTALNVINDAALELKLISSAMTDPFTSTDPNIVQLRTLLKSTGQALLREHDWNQHVNEYTVVTSAGVSTYALPADFMRMINQSGWNRTSQLPLVGPMTSETWQYLHGQSVGVVVTVLFRLYQRQLQLYPDTAMPAGYTIAFEYRSRYWVQATGQSAGNKEAPTASTDTLLYDRLLLVRALKLDWLKANNFDTGSAKEDRDQALAAVKSDDSPAPVLNLALHGGLPLLGVANLPDTGYGS